VSYRIFLFCLLACVLATRAYAASSTVFKDFTLDAALPDTFKTNTIYRISGVAAVTTSRLEFRWVPTTSGAEQEILFPIITTSSSREFTNWLVFDKPGTYQFYLNSQAAGEPYDVYAAPKQAFSVTVSENTAAPANPPTEFFNTYFGRLKFAEPVVQYAATFKRPRLTLDLQGISSKPKSIEFSILQYAGAVVPQLHDDGLNGDAVAGDDIYSLQLPECDVSVVICIPEWYRPFMRDVGIAEYKALATVTFENRPTEYHSATLGLVSAATELVTLEPLTDSAFKTGHLLNIVDPGGTLLMGPGSDIDMKKVSKQFYEYFPDRYDFLFYRLQTYRNSGLQGYYVPLNLPFSGTGRQSPGQNQLYGSKARLQGAMFVNFGTLTPHIHELMHHWANHSPLLNAGDGSHWGISDVQGVLGGDVDFSRVTSLGNDEYSIPWPQGAGSSFAGKYGKLELYLAGLLPASEVSRVTLLKNPQFVRNVFEGSTLKARVFRSSEGIKTYTVDDITRDVGLRTPAFGSSQTAFTAATVVVSTAPLDRLTATWMNQQMKLITSQADNDYAFAAATGFRATLDGTLGEPTSSKWPLLGTVRSTASSTATSRAEIAGGAAVADTANFASQFSASQAIDVVATVKPDPAHVGQRGRLYVLATLDDGRQFVLRANGAFVPFTGLANLEPLRTSALEPLEFISVANGLKGAGSGLVGKTVSVNVGYALDSAPQEIWYASAPIRFTIEAR